MVVYQIKVRPVESYGNGSESLECTSAITTKPFATKKKANPEEPHLETQRVEQGGGPKLLQELHTPHR